MNSKRGLSDVVTNVLIILLVIIAVGILWTFLQPLFKSSGEKIDKAQSCLETIFEPVKCSLNGATGANVTIKRTEAEGDAKELKVIFANSDGSTSAFNQSAVPGALETKVYTINSGFAPQSITVAAGIAGADGSVSYCKEGVALTCR